MSTLARVIRLSLAYKRLFIFCILLVILLAPLAALRPYLVNVGIDTVSYTHLTLPTKLEV